MTNALMSKFNMEGKARTKNGVQIGKKKEPFKPTLLMKSVQGNTHSLRINEVQIIQN